MTNHCPHMHIQYVLAHPLTHTHTHICSLFLFSLSFCNHLLNLQQFLTPILYSVPFLLPTLSSMHFFSFPIFFPNLHFMFLCFVLSFLPLLRPSFFYLYPCTFFVHCILSLQYYCPCFSLPPSLPLHPFPLLSWIFAVLSRKPAAP